MPNDNVLIHFMDELAPEMLFAIGLLVILAYIAVKAIPIMKDLKLASIESNKEYKLKQLDFEERQAKMKADESERSNKLSQETNRVISEQNTILTSLVSTNDAMRLQMATLNTSLADSKKRSEDMGDVVSSLNDVANDIKEDVNYVRNQVGDIHAVIVKQERLPI